MVTPAVPVYELRIELDDVEPPIWRTFLVPADIALDELHVVIQIVMGWTNSHLHEFRLGDERYGVPDADGFDLDEDFNDEADHLLQEVLKRPKQHLTYTYDFGDDWTHTVTLVAIHAGSDHALTCLAGARACPPDDCGGPHGYAELLDILAKPKKSRQDREMVEWFRSMTPKGHDTEVFPIADVNEHLAVGLDDIVEDFRATEEDGWD